MKGLKSKTLGKIRFSYTFDMGGVEQTDVDIEIPFDLEQTTWQEATKKLEKEFWKFVNVKNGNAKRNPTIELTERTISGVKEYLIANCGDGVLMKILDAIFNGESQSSIAARLEISQAAISERITNFGESRLGYLVEDYFRWKTGDKRNRIKRTDPDVITKYGEIWSIKSSIRYRSSQLIYPIKDCSPELHYALTQGKNFSIIFINPLWEDKPLRQEINPKEPLEWVSFFKSGEVRIPY